MTPARISVLTICGIDELPEHGPRAVTHVLSLAWCRTPAMKRRPVADSWYSAPASKNALRSPSKSET